ncbi:EamA family transporter [Paenibacillus silvae]|uniref:Multidrug transporter n=1 Tax=Paenibacillus silvae TaxID=1325358 RepID=A0ABQ1ZAJ8_9BACL|nr:MULTISPECIES: DMT family transporter [Paenibacillus]MCK6073653.1 DMT family transporter [Paenibacillus silvae]MCK6148871.1 DMT family transporter [Paenibacillus silvae]MCK6267170.1 DMT family transporter [Paenibacillus silvae]GGH53206.1 multidrug transporter [Paenibacillus silvae]
MKYYLSVLAGAMSYGILSTIVVLAYGQGYQLGEVVGTQLITGFILSWMLALYTRFRAGRRSKRGVQHNGKTASASASTVFARLTWKQRLLLMAAGTPTVITGLVYYQSLRYIPASLAIILLFQFTWISVLIQAISKRQRPDKVTFLTLLILFGGTLLAAGFLEQGLGEFSGLGIALGLMAAVSYSLFVLFSGKAVPSAHPAFRSAWMVTGGLILLCILFPPTFLFNGLIWSQLLVFGLLLGFFGAFIPPVLFAIGVPHIGGDMAGILGAVELPVAVLLSSIVLHEHVSGLQWIGVIIVLIGVALPELYKMRMRRSQSQSRPLYS